MPDFLPRADAAFYQWSLNFHEKVAASYEQYGFTAERAAELTSAFSAFDLAYHQMHDPLTRTSPTAATKREARAELERVMRSMAKWVRAQATVPAGDLVGLGLRPTVKTRARIAPPASAPTLRLIDLNAGRARLLVRDSNSPYRRGKPRDVAAALIFVQVGDDDGPVRVHQTSHTRLVVPLSRALEPGTRVRVWARWVNPRYQQGPESAVLELRVDYTLMRLGA